METMERGLVETHTIVKAQCNGITTDSATLNYPGSTDINRRGIYKNEVRSTQKLQQIS